MNLPFTAEQFFDVFRKYNQAVWPAQVVLTLLALVVVALLIRPNPLRAKAVALILVLLWAWTGIAYHVTFFSEINRAAYAFGALFVAGSAAFLAGGVLRGRMRISPQGRMRIVTGWTLITYALIGYPLLCIATGHAYPAMPTFGLPCPTTIFTIGVLTLLEPPIPSSTLVAPLIWAAIGSTAAFTLGVYPDLGLLAAGLVVVWLMLSSRRADVPGRVAP